MTPSTGFRRAALAAASAAVLASGVLSACGTKNETTEKPAESTTPRPSATAPAPTEKAVAPSPKPDTTAGNSFAPTVKAPPAPTALPGNVITGG